MTISYSLAADLWREFVSQKFAQGVVKALEVPSNLTISDEANRRRSEFLCAWAQALNPAVQLSTTPNPFADTNPPQILT